MKITNATKKKKKPFEKDIIKTRVIQPLTYIRVFIVKKKYSYTRMCIR